MPRVYLSLGSNIDPPRHLRAAIHDLSQRFGELSLSTVYESEAVGFDGDNFYNLVAAFDSTEPVEEIAAVLREIEDRHGRDRSQPRFSARTLDVDLLLYGDAILHQNGLSLPRDEITKNAFVLWPLAEIAPQLQHPVLHQTMASLWQSFDRNKQQLWPVPMEWTAP